MGEGALERHQLLVKVVIKLIVDRGFNYGCHPNWEQAETEVLKLEKLEQVVVSRPGVHFYHAGDYLEAFPKGIDHHRRDGHYEGQLEGQEGFYVPQKGPVTIQYNSIQQSKQESTVDDGTELLTPDQLDVKAKDLLMDMSTGCNMAALGLKRRGVSDAQASSATAKASGAPPRASSAPPKSSSVSAQPRSATANDSTPKKQPQASRLILQRMQRSRANRRVWRRPRVSVGGPRKIWRWSCQKCAPLLVRTIRQIVSLGVLRLIPR